jgi:creatinine amidohydrolase
MGKIDFLVSRPKEINTMPRKISITTRIALVFAVLLAALPVQAQIYHAGEMTTENYRTLDRNKTVVILTTGILEEHGPYMPAYTDGYISEALVKDVTAAVVAKGWNVLIFPPIPLGSGGVNELAAKYPFPGTFVVRLNTLRAVFMDLADELAEAGFRKIFIANNHGAPNHNRALDQVCDYFKETYDGQMIVLRGMPTAATAKMEAELEKMLSEQARKEDAASGHAGIVETSLMLFLQPKLVDPNYVKAPAQTAPEFGDMITIAKGPNWLGYYGAPRFSTAAYGVTLYKSWADQTVEQALKALEGTVPALPGFAGSMISPPHAAALKRDEAIEKRQQEWLQKKGIK